jgi:hypothetical protein
LSHVKQIKKHSSRGVSSVKSINRLLLADDFSVFLYEKEQLLFLLVCCRKWRNHKSDGSEHQKGMKILLADADNALVVMIRGKCVCLRKRHRFINSPLSIKSMSFFNLVAEFLTTPPPR